jgi:hypothetical protein
LGDNDVNWRREIMFARICLLSALAMGALAGPAVSADGPSTTGSELRDGHPIMMAQLQRFITPKKVHIRPQAAPCPNYFGQC